MRTREAAADEAQAVKLVPPIEKVRFEKLTATHGKAYVGVALETCTTGGEATRLELGLDAEDAATLGAQPVQLGEKLGATEHRSGRRSVRWPDPGSPCLCRSRPLGPRRLGRR